MSGLQAKALGFAISLVALSTASAKPKEKFSGRIHFVAKGDVELALHDEVLGYHDSRKGGKYIDAVTRPYRFAAGGIVFFKMRSTAVHRYFIMALASRDGSCAIPVRRSDFRYLGAEVDRDDFSYEEILSLESPSDVGSGDPAMKAMWREHAFPESARRKSEWIELSSKRGMAHFALVITPELLGW